MANLQIKSIEDDFYAKIKEMAASENRSVSQQVIHLIKKYLAREKHLERSKSPAQVLLELSGSWNDERRAEEIIKDLRKKRKSSRKLSKGI